MNFLIYIRNIFIAFDQFCNTILKGDPRETISSRAGKAALQNKKWACILCKLLDKINKDHCQKAMDYTVGNRGIIKD